jgi:hypothetical protein
MAATGSAPQGPLTEWAKSAGLISDGATAAGRGLSALGKGVWRAAGVAAPNPIARAGLIGASGLALKTQVPQLAGRATQDYHYAHGTTPATSRGF